MRKKLLMLVFGLTVALGALSSREASAAPPYCPPLCIDPELTCCIPCWYQPAYGCVCGEYCEIEP